MVVYARTRDDMPTTMKALQESVLSDKAVPRAALEDAIRPREKLESARPLYLRAAAPETSTRARTAASPRASAYMEVGGENRLMGVVHGPRRAQTGSSSGPSAMSSMRVEVKYAPFAGGDSACEQEMSARVREVVSAAVCSAELAASALVVDLHVLLINSGGGGDLAHAITCASMALANALVPMRDIVTAAYVVRDKCSSNSSSPLRNRSLCVTNCAV